MKKFLRIRNQITGPTKLVMAALSISIIGLTSSCSWVGRNNTIEISSKPEEIANEIVMFCGNPGVGKSSLLNSIVQQKIFESGSSVGVGKTTNKQSFVCNGVAYMDTPGLSDVSLREQAAKEIEKALKENNNYKIVFVATLESGRIRPDDLTTINLICESIKTDFNYGVIFNKVTKKLAKQVSGSPEQWIPYIKPLTKKPSNIIIILRDEDMEDEDNVFLPIDSENRIKLMNFIANLPANRILSQAVEPIKAHQYDAINNQMQEMLKTLKDELKETRQMNNQLIMGQMQMFKDMNQKLYESNKDLTNKLVDNSGDSNGCLVM